MGPKGAQRRHWKARRASGVSLHAQRALPSHNHANCYETEDFKIAVWSWCEDCWENETKKKGPHSGSRQVKLIPEECTVNGNENTIDLINHRLGCGHGEPTDSFTGITFWAKKPGRVVVRGKGGLCMECKKLHEIQPITVKGNEIYELTFTCCKTGEVGWDLDEPLELEYYPHYSKKSSRALTVPSSTCLFCHKEITDLSTMMECSEGHGQMHDTCAAECLLLSQHATACPNCRPTPVQRKLLSECDQNCHLVVYSYHDNAVIDALKGGDQKELDKLGASEIVTAMTSSGIKHRHPMPITFLRFPNHQMAAKAQATLRVEHAVKAKWNSNWTRAELKARKWRDINDAISDCGSLEGIAKKVLNPQATASNTTSNGSTWSFPESQGRDSPFTITSSERGQSPIALDSSDTDSDMVIVPSPERLASPGLPMGSPAFPSAV